MEWEKITLLKPIELYNTDDQLQGYLFNIIIDGTPKGYISIGNDLNEYPVWEWSYDGSQITESQLKTAKDKKAKNKDIKDIKVISLFAGRYAFEFNYTDGSEDIIGTNGLRIKKENIDKKIKDKGDNSEKARLYWKEIANNVSTGEIGTINDGVTDVNPDNWESGYQWMKRNYINGVTDKNQYQYDGFNWTGCAPTAAANMMWYMGYRMDTLDNTMWSLRYYLNTFQSYNGSGSTYISDIVPGLTNYAKARRPGTTPLVYNLGNYNTGSSAPYEYLVSEVERSKPSVLTIIDQSYYGDGGHSVTLVGYKYYSYNNSSVGHQYAVIHDNWANTPQSVYLAYGRNYDCLLQTIFIP